jgi:DNA/RNA endonuclease YhcR with UshA esterase domain
MLRSLRLIITSMVLIAGAAAAPADSLNPEESASHVGKNATVCGLVASATYAAGSAAAPTFLDFGKPYPNETFTAVIFGSDRKKFGTPEMSLREKQVCVTGEIRLYQGKPQIILRDPKQLSER